MNPQYTSVQSSSTHQAPNINQPSNDEIDLIEILMVLWKGKKLIIITMIFFLFPTLLWLFTRPSAYELDILIDIAPSYSIDALQPSTLVGGDQYQVEKLKNDLLFQKATTQAETLHFQRLFWENQSKQVLSESSSPLTEANSDLAFENFSRKLKLIKPDPKKTASTVNKITLTTTDPTNDIELLKAYLRFLNDHVVRTAIAQLEEGYASKLFALKADHSRLIIRERKRLNDRLALLTEQLQIARSLKIIDIPYEKLSGIELKIVDDRLYVLGVKALEEEINALKIRQEIPPSTFVDELRNMEHWQKTMEDDLQKLQSVQNTVSVFEIIGPPAASLDSVNRSKLLVVIGILFLASVIGSIIVLMKYGITKYKGRTPPIAAP